MSIAIGSPNWALELPVGAFERISSSFLIQPNNNLLNSSCCCCEKERKIAEEIYGEEATINNLTFLSLVTLFCSFSDLFTDRASLCGDLYGCKYAGMWGRI
jgi:hypothetical protein